jgi:hypothetical protein
MLQLLDDSEIIELITCSEQMSQNYSFIGNSWTLVTLYQK